MNKSEITYEYIKFAIHDDIKYLENEYGTTVNFEPITDIQIVELSRTDLNNIALGYKKHSYRCLEKSDNININPGECVIDYIIYELSGKPYFKKLTRKELIKSFNGTSVTTQQIIDWAKTKNVLSVYALDALNNVFNSYVAENQQYTLTFYF